MSEPRSDDAFQRAISTGNIVDAESNAVRVAEIELRKIAVQVLLCTMLIYALSCPRLKIE